jgi:dipeptidyl-peptidase-4
MGSDERTQLSPRDYLFHFFQKYLPSCLFRVPLKTIHRRQTPLLFVRRSHLAQLTLYSCGTGDLIQSLLRVISAQGGATKWMELRGDSRNHYVARMEWAENANELIVEYLNRLQNTNQVLLANAHTGATMTLFEDKDAAWVDGVGSFDRVGHETGLVWLSERDGWCHAYVISRATGEPRLITNFPGDVISEIAVDDAGGWFYFLASPQDATRKYLYRSRLNGSGAPQQLTPTNQPGTHGYDISPDGQWAVHTFSTFDYSPATALTHLANHEVTRTLEAN